MTASQPGLIYNQPFTVGNQGEVFFVALVDYSEVASLDLAIVSDETKEEVTVSEDGKYQTMIQSQPLPEGDYRLVIRSNMPGTVRFTLDVMRELEVAAEVSW